MPNRFKATAVAALVLAGGFYWFFFFAKHDPKLAPLVPFGDDPYDAGGSFCMIASVLLAILSVTRSFRRNRSEAVRTGQVYLARAQAAVPAGILVTLYIDCIALARHPGQWMGRPGTVELLVLMAAIATSALVVLALVRWAARTGASAAGSGMRWAWLSLVIVGMVMAVFPESVIRFVIWHFLAILSGVAIVAWPQARLACAVVPQAEIAPVPFRRPWLPWMLIALFGTAIGASVLAMELSEGDGGSLMQRILVVAMFLGAGTGTMVIGYAFLGTPLGLFRELATAEPAQAAK